MRVVPAYVVIWLSASCATEAQVPDIPDGRADADLCVCPTGDLLADNLRRHEIIGEVRAGWSNLPTSCDDSADHEDWVLLDGGCRIAPFHQSATMSWAGLQPKFDGSFTWNCRWYNDTPFARLITATGLCMEPSIASKPAECGCPPVQPFRERVYPVRVSAPFIPGEINSVVAACEAGDLLLTGGCTTNPDLEPPAVTLLRAGFAPQDPDFWACTWSHAGGPVTGIMHATIMCVRPPDPDTAPETEPLADRVIHRSVTNNMGTLSPMTNSTTCRNNEFLLGGSCMIDSTEPDSYLVTQNLYADDELVPTAWRCGWHNPTQTKGIPGITTAICLRPPGEP